MTFKNAGVDEVCSGSLISPTFIMTAGHCIINESNQQNTDFIFTAPGTRLDAAVNPATMPKILKTYFPADFKVSEYMERNDIAFIQLDKPLATKGFIRIATAAEVNALTDGQALKGYGYGAVYETGATYSIYPREYSTNWRTSMDMANLKTNQIYSANSVACSGDSGGPITAKLPSGVEVLIGNMSGAALVIDRCGTQAADGKFNMQMTIANKYLSLIQTELTKSLATPTPKATTKPTPKIIKITCVKGKIKKVISGTNPKCPTGYKKV